MSAFSGSLGLATGSNLGPISSIFALGSNWKATTVLKTKTTINAGANIIAIDHETHMKITGYYKRFYGDTGMSLRDYLAGQSYDTQYKVGMDVLKMFSVIE